MAWVQVKLILYHAMGYRARTEVAWVQVKLSMAVIHHVMVYRARTEFIHDFFMLFTNGISVADLQSSLCKRSQNRQALGIPSAKSIAKA